MKAKLVKKQEGWYNLYQNDIGIGSTHTELQGYKLSLANCQAIERGYDLDELAMVYDLYENINFVGQMRAFKSGFQKALELMGDKKFSEDDMKRIYEKGYSSGRSELNSRESDKIKYDYIKSLQHVEWDVEIEMTKEEYTWSPPGEGFEDQTYRDWREVPQLDENGCLILKICQ